MGVYRFKITFEDHEDISREIEIKSTQTFEDLHHAIQQAIGFDDLQPASFYMSNDHWIKGQEISLNQRPPHKGEHCILMKDALLSNWINDPHQKIYYVSDYDAMWTFHIELYRIFPHVDPAKTYPACVKMSGDAPKQRGTIIPVKENVDAEEEVLVMEDYHEEDEETEAGEEGVINPDEADDVTSGEPSDIGPIEEEEL
jgi:hypothetical protein